MYFAVIGKHPTISKKELFYQGFVADQEYNPIILISKDPCKQSLLGGVIKQGKISTIQKYYEAKKTELVGVSDKSLGQFLKKQGYTRRYKIIDTQHSDKEVKEKGVEMILLNKGKKINEETEIGIVENYQNIALYEAIDFGKPMRGMNVGMMPAKLALTLINVATGQYKQDKPITIYDPFAGFGTTNFLANHLGYNTIGSDLNITALKKNWQWRETQEHFQNQNKSVFFKHDVCDPYKKNFLKHTTCIVSEGRLGPILKRNTQQHEATQYIKAVQKTYKAFLKNVEDFFEKGTVISMTAPYHMRFEHGLQEILEKQTETRTQPAYIFPEIYVRKKQSVGRQIFTAIV